MSNLPPVPDEGIPEELENWVWAQHISATAERVWRIHWMAASKQAREGGGWITAISQEDIVQRIGATHRAVKRAYKTLGNLGLIRQLDPPQASTTRKKTITRTEVLIPGELLSKFYN